MVDIDAIKKLCVDFSGKFPTAIETLPISGSSRRYYRLYISDVSFIGLYNTNIEENRLFIYFSKHFRQKGLNVPEIFAISDDYSCYLQEDLGNEMLLDIVNKHRLKDKSLSKDTLVLYKKALDELLRFQFLGNQDLDYSYCIPSPAFDRTAIFWDLNYFKYCFLRLAGVQFNEKALEEDFILLADQATSVPMDTFMFRDFQSRNIMIKDGCVWFIDYQGGRRGALHYDVASLLYDAIIEMPVCQKEELLDYYISSLQSYRIIAADDFRNDYYCFVLLRLLQAMGAFGLRGLYERKAHFLSSISPGIETIYELLNLQLKNTYPEINRIITSLRGKY